MGFANLGVRHGADLSILMELGDIFETGGGIATHGPWAGLVRDLVLDIRREIEERLAL